MQRRHLISQLSLQTIVLTSHAIAQETIKSDIKSIVLTSHAIAQETIKSDIKTSKNQPGYYRQVLEVRVTVLVVCMPIY